MENFFNKFLLKSTVILFYGCPLSGKGTQSKKLGELFNIPVISSGDVFRELAATKSPLALEIDGYMGRGELVPNELVRQVFINKFIDPKYFNGFILDGFVREKDNIELLNEILSSIDAELGCVINLEAPIDVLIERLELRTKLTNTPRQDDKLEIFKTRHEIFLQTSAQVIPELQAQVGSKFHTIQSVASVEEIFNQIIIKVTQTYVSAYVDGDLFKLNKQCEYVSSIQNKIYPFVTQSLEINKVNSTGQSRHFIFLKTSNFHKYKEFDEEFKKYGIETLILPWVFETSDYEQIFSTVQQIPNTKLIGIFEEETALLKYFCGSTNDESLYAKVRVRDNVKAINWSRLKVYIYNKTIEHIVVQTYTSKIPGKISLEKKSKFQNGIFGWDDIFVMESNGMTFNELKKIGLKLSARNLNICKWFKSFLHYKKLIDLNFNPLNSSKPIDFTNDPLEFISSHKYFTNQYSIKCGFYNMLVGILNQGVWFKSAPNRRVKNYWCPGLNGGIPLVPKSDEIHECTFMAHDLGHFGIPDLIFTGHSSPIHSQVYICWRMMSESFTMAMGDMGFVDTLVKSGIEYDYSKRRIYNLFVDTGIQFDYNGSIDMYLSNLKKIMWANYRWALLGDETPYRALLDSNNSSQSNLKLFVEKYTPFFVSDYKWTCANYENLVSKSEDFISWYISLNPYIDSLGNLYTIDQIVEIIGSNPDGDIFEQIFNFIFDKLVSKLFLAKTQPDPFVRRQTKAFKRYLIGQSLIFFKFYFVPESKKYFKQICNYLDMDIITNESISSCQQIYSDYLGLLLSKGFISSDDYDTWNEVYPIFDPIYLSYDVNPSDTIESISSKIFAKPIINKTILSKTNYLIQMVQMGGGIVVSDKYVIKPGVMLLSDLNSYQSDNLVTFLIAGCSIEASLELIAHSEAKVARLTTSKTNAMNNPLYRIYNELHNLTIDTRFQKKLIDEIQQIRKEWNGMIPNEIFNTMNIGNKCTALTYSIKLADLHKLFIGRSRADGNESEVRSVIKSMHEVIHSKYPELPSWDSYLKSGNENKQSWYLLFDFKTPKTQTKLTTEAIKLFRQLNICGETPEWAQMAEFRSRITYLSFNPTMPTKDETCKYLDKIVCELSHLSILSAWQVITNKFEVANLKNVWNDSWMMDR